MASAYKNMFLFILIAALNGCNSEKDIQRVFNKYLRELNNNSEIPVIRNNLKDSIDSWIDKRLDFVMFLPRTSWVVDSCVFFNKKKDKALLLLLVQVNYSPWSRDYSRIVAGEKIDGLWKFYYPSYPIMEFDRINKEKKLSFSYLSQRGRNELIDDGFVECNPSCKINYGYVESDIWFADWMRKMHMDFLNNKLHLAAPEKPGDRMH